MFLGLILDGNFDTALGDALDDADGYDGHEQSENLANENIGGGVRTQEGITLFMDRNISKVRKKCKNWGK